MPLPFLDREDELGRIDRALSGPPGALVVLYGRRRCGKSRLLLQAIGKRGAAYYVGDEREAGLQRRTVAATIEAVIPGFSRVEYPDWDSLLDRWWREANDGAVLALDEFPYLVRTAPELPSLIQKRIDSRARKRLPVVLCGSSQRMMHGLVLDASAPLYGRAREILRIQPLEFGWLTDAFPRKTSRELLEAYAMFGGIPRYWELISAFDSVREAARELMLDPLGVLLDEPARLLLDDVAEATQAASILSLVGEGCHRMSEIAARLGKPATSVSRPLRNLVDLGFIRRDIPFGASVRDAKRSRYRLGDPFLQFWFRFVEPRRTMIEARQRALLEREFAEGLQLQIGQVWEDLARASVARLEIKGQRWRPASRWWGAGRDQQPLEIDVVAESEDRSSLLIGEVKTTVAKSEWPRLFAELKNRAAQFPNAHRREIIPCIWYGGAVPAPKPFASIGMEQVLKALR